MKTGLTTEEAEELLRNGKGNTPPATNTRTIPQIIRKNLFTYFNLIYLILTVMVVAAGSYKSLTFLPAVIANTLIGTIQEISAKRTIDRLTIINEAAVPTLRDGVETMLPPERLVLGDVVIFRSGMQIPADAEVLDGQLSVNEALLTGEADEIEKKPGSELFSGSFVVSGECRAVLIRVGDDEYASKLIQEAREQHGSGQSEMVRDLNTIILFTAIAIVPMGLALFCNSYYSGAPFRDSIESVVAVVVGMIPQGLTLLFSTALAISAVRLGRKKVLLHDMRSVETLARVDVLCVDKTGTITENEMTVKDFVVFYEEQENPVKTSSLLSSYLAAMPDQNATMLALRDRFKSKEALASDRVEPFSSGKKYSSLKSGEKEYRLGAPEVLLTDGQLKRYEAVLQEYAQDGLRVLAFIVIEKGKSHLLALITLENPIRPDAEEAFSQFREQGVRVLVLSGDNPLTVSRLAESVGIEGAENYVSAADLKDDAALREALQTKTVFGRMKPEQKKQVVELLKEQGCRVAMTGDGVNDILAMREADCSIAMGSGAEAAMQMAQVVLLDSSFSRMKDIVAEGRRDINNIERSATLFLVKNLFSLFLGIFSVFMLEAYPLKPTQVSLISSFNIGIPATLLALEQNENKPKGRFLKKVLLRALPAAITDFVVIASMAMFGEIFGLTADNVSVAATYLLAIVGFMILIRISRPMNRYRFGVLFCCVLGLALSASLFSDLFSMTQLSLQCLLLLIVFAITTEPILRYLTLFFEWTEKTVQRRKAKKTEDWNPAEREKQTEQSISGSEGRLPDTHSVSKMNKI